MTEYINIHVVIVLPRDCHFGEDGKAHGPHKGSGHNHGPPGQRIPPDQINLNPPPIMLFPKEINPAGPTAEDATARKNKVEALSNILEAAQAVYNGT